MRRGKSSKPLHAVGSRFQREAVVRRIGRGEAMRYVIIRDDDTNASTPVECLERLYRPALDRGMPVNLATIPEVSLEARNEEDNLEGFLRFKNGATEKVLPIAANHKLTEYLRANQGYEILQHGLHHEYFEFERLRRD